MGLSSGKGFKGESGKNTTARVIARRNADSEAPAPSPGAAGAGGARGAVVARAGRGRAAAPTRSTPRRPTDPRAQATAPGPRPPERPSARAPCPRRVRPPPPPPPRGSTRGRRALRSGLCAADPGPPPGLLRGARNDSGGRGPRPPAPHRAGTQRALPGRSAAELSLCGVDGAARSPRQTGAPGRRPHAHSPLPSGCAASPAPAAPSGLPPAPAPLPCTARPCAPGAGGGRSPAGPGPGGAEPSGRGASLGPPLPRAGGARGKLRRTWGPSRPPAPRPRVCDGPRPPWAPARTPGVAMGPRVSREPVGAGRGEASQRADPAGGAEVGGCHLPAWKETSCGGGGGGFCAQTCASSGTRSALGPELRASGAREPRGAPKDRWAAGPEPRASASRVPAPLRAGIVAGEGLAVPGRGPGPFHGLLGASRPRPRGGAAPAPLGSDLGCLVHPILGSYEQGAQGPGSENGLVLGAPPRPSGSLEPTLQPVPGTLLPPRPTESVVPLGGRSPPGSALTRLPSTAGLADPGAGAAHGGPWERGGRPKGDEACERGRGSALGSARGRPARRVLGPAPWPEGSMGRVPAPAQGAAPAWPHGAPHHPDTRPCLAQPEGPCAPRAPSWATSLSPGDIESRPRCPTDCAKVWGSQPHPRRRELPSARVPGAPSWHVGVSEGPRALQREQGPRAPEPVVWQRSSRPLPRARGGGQVGAPGAREGAGGTRSCSPERSGPGRGSAAPLAPTLAGTWPGGPHVGLRDLQGLSPSVPGTRGCVGRAGAGGPVNAVPPCERPQPPAVSPARRTGPARGAPHSGAPARAAASA
uniref:collagen alpha-1(I) chain-like n=1 Tax=Nyctereutes procyonoides TaxID=34880 RepID=UPI00244538BE|nr:collagen alpha-1(I) chain-like [Nyctereutes procyonoides]